MNRTAWLSGVAAAALLAGASAPSVSTAAPIPAAFSYADLLDPVPDAAARLAIDDAAHDHEARLQTVQYRREHHHHHHHHHHHSWQAYPDGGYYLNGGSWGPTPYYTQAQPWYGGPGAYSSGWGWVAPAPYYRDHHHHHHHHHHHAWRRW